MLTQLLAIARQQPEEAEDAEEGRPHPEPEVSGLDKGTHQIDASMQALYKKAWIAGGEQKLGTIVTSSPWIFGG